MTIVLLILAIGAACVSYVAGCEKGYHDALEEIFGESAPRCPHGYDWDECPDCCH